VPSRTFQGLGPDSLVPRLKPATLNTLKLDAEEGFVLSRVDGRLTVGEICLLVPFEPETTANILGRLQRVGALEIPGSVAPVPPPPAPPPGLELTAEQMHRIDEFFATLDTRDAFELLEVTDGADKKEIKRAYFKLSKEFHPDRFFGKNLGPYRERVSRIFQSVKAAFELLSDDARRNAYLESGNRK
jgi:hypothetical protein